MSNFGRSKRADEPQVDDRADDHLRDVDDGCGCVEVWEYLSERRGSD